MEAGPSLLRVLDQGRDRVQQRRRLTFAAGRGQQHHFRLGCAGMNRAKTFRQPLGHYPWLHASGEGRPPRRQRAIEELDHDVQRRRTCTNFRQHIPVDDLPPRWHVEHLKRRSFSWRLFFALDPIFGGRLAVRALPLRVRWSSLRFKRLGPVLHIGGHLANRICPNLEQAFPEADPFRVSVIGNICPNLDQTCGPFDKRGILPHCCGNALQPSGGNAS